ncbi:DUF669 domain-containing protein [Listeria monocytogenes]|nr:DUF669 domain-containing protein [Listeria monocytogenes]EAH3811456.1 DUF669 domain-containing protein [Listeria monocytogenes]EJD5418348.1 DUF669 domain-containing protein [Listeria monocytogenes]HAK1062944.1 DUF669 domain-containing protein [Listeria monocytogenes]HAK1199811.1 DUF669 domain-containing protein [Listeria monocytogenes]
MVFKLDTEDVFGGQVEDGVYEVIINHATEDATPSGAEYINVDLIIRNDINQKFKNAHIFHSIWKAKKNNQYNAKSINTIGKAVGLANGKEYNSLTEVLEDFALKTCRISVKNETSEYNGKTYNNLNVKSWAESKIPGPANHQFAAKDIAQQDNQPMNITDDDLPF